MQTTSKHGTLTGSTPDSAYCPFGASPFHPACGRPDCRTERAPRPDDAEDESIRDLVRLLARSRPSHRRADPCLWAK